jgi:AraC-like DNA-binding protein
VYRPTKLLPFMPMQPALEQLPTYCHRMIRETHPLYSIVSLIYEFVPNGEKSFNITAIPDGCLDIVFQFYDDCVRSFIYGCTREPLSIDWSTCSRCFGFRLYPGAIGNLLRCPAKNLTANYTQIVCNINFYDELFEKIPFSNSFDERVLLVQHFFENLIAKGYHTPSSVSHMVNKIISSGGNITIKELCEETGYSLSHFHNIFDKYVGISPKEFAEVVRFQRSLLLLYAGSDVNLAEISCQCGYYDQSRMNRAYKSFAGYSPNKFKKIISNQYKIKAFSLL